MKDEVVLRKNKNIVTRVIDDETILLPVYRSSGEINCIYTLNSVASRVWQLIDGKRSLIKIKSRLLDEFDTDVKEVDKEMSSFLNDLKEIKAIV